MVENDLLEIDLGVLHNEDYISNRLSEKKILITQLLEEASNKKEKYGKFHEFYKHVNNTFDVSIAILSGITTTSLFVTLKEKNDTMLLTSAVFSSMSFLLSVVKKSLSFQNKETVSNQLFLNYSSLYRDFSTLMVKSILTSSELDAILNDLNHRLALIEKNEL